VIERDLISKEEIVKVFNRKIKPRLAGLEAERNKSFVQAIMMCFLIVCVAGAITVLNIETLGDKIIFVFAISLFLIVGVFKFCMRAFVSKFKDEVVEEVLRALIPNCNYNPDQLLSQNYVDDSKLISNSYNRFNGEDYVKGKIGDMTVEFSELHLRKVTGSGKNKKDVKIFRGLFFYFSLNRSLGHNTMIRHDVGEALFGANIGRFFQKGSAPEGYELVQLESVEFEKKYSVYSMTRLKRVCFSLLQ
jgi:energy-converting hydrogenase Eha subunit A